MSDAQQIPKACRLTLDTNDLDAMMSFYTERLGFELVEATTPGFMFQKSLVRQAHTGVEVLFRDCLPRPHVGSMIGSLLELELVVGDLDKAIDGLTLDERHPETGEAERVKLRDPSNYTLTLVRTG